MKFALSLLLATAAIAGPISASRARLTSKVAPHFKQAVNRVRNVARKAEEPQSTEPAAPTEPARPTAGGTAPFGKFWDPAGFTKQISNNEVRRYREAEITHSRLAMLGVLGFLTQEAFH